MKSMILGLIVTAMTGTALAQQQSSAEVSCRAKAKEVAAQTYNSCVTEARNGQIDQIRKDYQKQLSDLKAKYDRELKKIGGKNTAAKELPPVEGSSDLKINLTPASSDTDSHPVEGTPESI